MKLENMTKAQLIKEIKRLREKCSNSAMADAIDDHNKHVRKIWADEYMEEQIKPEGDFFVHKPM